MREIYDLHVFVNYMDVVQYFRYSTDIGKKWFEYHANTCYHRKFDDISFQNVTVNKVLLGKSLYW